LGGFTGKLIIMRILFVIAFMVTLPAAAQDKILVELEKQILLRESEAHLLFLAADEMRGRDTGSPELDIAANYIRAQFRMLGLQPPPGMNDYFQSVHLVKHSVPTKGRAVIGNSAFTLRDDLVVLDGGAVEWTGDLIYVGYGSADELAKSDLRGKMVLAIAGARDSDNINKIILASREKYNAVRKMGAAGLVEFIATPQVPWPSLVNFFHRERWGLNEDNTSIPFIWVKPRDIRKLSFRENTAISGAVSVERVPPRLIPGKNVAAMLEGTDPGLKDEYVIVTAHYDHVGVDKQHREDSIFNGARDNATGTVALIQSAKFLSQYKPKRPILFVALTGEEKGLLGSQWYVKHPLIPLNKTVLNLNCDGVGYNDKSRVTSISLGRTNMDDVLLKAAQAFGFALGGDPDPREGFYERSDQVSFAREGVPALKLQPGLSKMDDEIRQYYHRPADEVSSMDLNYINTFYKTFTYALYLLASEARRPQWITGDKFEEAARKLYGR
jgi:hypothetical protein